MSEDKKSYTLESFQAEREKLQKEAKERFEKQELEKKKKGNDLLRYLRLINEDDIKIFFSINEGGSNNLKRNLAIVAISYLLEDDIDFIDKLEIKDFISLKSIEDLQNYINKIAKVSSNIKDQDYFLKIILVLITNLQSNNKKSGLLYDSSVGTIRYMLEIILNNYFDYSSYNQSFKGDLTIYSNNDLLKNNNILKKIDYLSYVKKCVDSGKGFIDAHSDLLNTSEIRSNYCEEYTPKGDYVWGDAEEITDDKFSPENVKVIEKTNLLFTGNEQIYDNKKRLIKSFNYINGIYSGNSNIYLFEHYGHLNGGYKTDTPKGSTIYVENDKIFSSFEKKPNKIIKGSEKLFGEITQYDVEGKIIEKFIKKNNLIFNIENSKDKNMVSPLLELTENNTSLPFYTNEDEYFVIHLSEKDHVPFGEIDNDIDEHVANGGFGDINLIHGGQFNEIYEEEITSAKPGVQYNTIFNYRLVIGHYQENDEDDKLVRLTLLKNEFFVKNNQSKDKIKNEDKYKALLTYTDNFLANEEILNCLNKINEIYQEADNIRYGLVPIFSNKISIVEGGDFDCDNGWHPYFVDKDYNFIQINLNKIDREFKELTEEDKKHLKEVSKEYMDQP